MNKKEILEKLNSADYEEIRLVIEEIAIDDIDDDIAEKLTGLLQVEDKGVLDSIARIFSLSTNHKIPFFIVNYITSPNISLRNLAGDILIKIGKPSVTALLQYINDADYNHRKFAIDILGLLKDPDVIKDISEQLRNENDENVILAGLEAFGNIGSEECLDILFEFYDKSELYKPTIVEAFGKIGSERIINFIYEKYPNEDELTKYAMIECLGLIGNQSTFYFLLGELAQIKGPLSWPLINSLYLLKSKYDLELPFDDSIKRAILKTLYEAEPQYKKSAAFLITVFDDKEIFEALLRIYGSDWELDELIKNNLIENKRLFLKKITGLIKEKTSNVKNLLWLLKDFVESVDESERLTPLSAFESENLYDAIIKCWDEPNEEVRKTATELLFSMNLEKALLFIDSISQDENLWNRLQVLEILEYIFDPRVNNVLLKFLNDSEEMIKEKAASILSDRGIEIN